MKPRKTIQQKIKESITRQQVSTRGGGVEISLDAFGFKGEYMSAYQNYLGGGLLGSVQANDTIRRQSYRDKQTDKVNAKLDKIAEALKRYFHNLTNPDTEWEGSSYEENQNRPASAY